MAVTTFHDFPLAPRDRKWDGAAAKKRVRAWAGAEDKPNGKYRDAHIWYDAGSKHNFYYLRRRERRSADHARGRWDLLQFGPAGGDPRARGSTSR